jgi:hypothetical protein
VKSFPPFSILHSFVHALNRKDIPITNDNVSYLSELCSKVGFSFLSLMLSEFYNSPEYQIYLLKSNVSEQTKKITKLEVTANWLASLQAAVMRAGNLIRKLWAAISSMKISKRPHSLLVDEISATIPLSLAPVINNAGYPAGAALLTRTPPTLTLFWQSDLLCALLQPATLASQWQCYHLPVLLPS